MGIEKKIEQLEFDFMKESKRDKKWYGNCATIAKGAASFATPFVGAYLYVALPWFALGRGNEFLEANYYLLRQILGA